jgi:hypothetical protein
MPTPTIAIPLRAGPKHLLDNFGGVAAGSIDPFLGTVAAPPAARERNLNFRGKGKQNIYKSSLWVLNF